MNGPHMFCLIHPIPWPSIYVPSSISMTASKQGWIAGVVALEILYEVRFEYLPNHVHCLAILDHMNALAETQVEAHNCEIVPDSGDPEQHHLVIEFKQEALAHYVTQMV